MTVGTVRYAGVPCYATGVQTYRVYRLDRVRHVVEVEWLAAASDKEAIAAARAMAHSGRREIWLGERLVATIVVEAASEPTAAFWL